MKIIINEEQVKFLNEDISTIGEVSYNLKESIAIWCLMNDFRFFIPNNIFGSKISVANSEQINREICSDIMNGEIMTADDEKELFGHNDHDDFEDGDDEREEFMNSNKIYKVQYGEEEYYIEVASDIYEYSGERILEKYIDKELDDTVWYYDSIDWFFKKFK